VKSGSGLDAVRWWQAGDDDSLDKLAYYNRQDVVLLAKLCQQKSIRLPTGGSTRVGPFGAADRFEEAEHGSQDSESTDSVADDGFPVFPLDSPQSLTQNSTAWYGYRFRKIGSSQAGALLRLSYHTTRDDAFESLIDPSPAASSEETDAMARGRRMEPEVARRYAKHTGYVLKEVGVFPHPEHGTWLFASPDRLVRTSDMEPGKFSLLECKSVSKLSSPPPAHWIIQCQLQLACSGAPWVDLAQLETGSETLLVHRIKLDIELIRSVIDRLSDVYRSAMRVFNGEVEADDAFADDIREFTRFDQQDVKAILEESMRLFVGKPELVRASGTP